MKRKRNIFLFIAILFLLLSGSAAYGAGAIQAVLFPVSYSINHETRELPEGFVTLNYANRAYVPVRFVAESLGARVAYDEENRVIELENSNVFSAPNLKIGDRVAGMEVVEMDLSEFGGMHWGRVRFSGEALLRGTYSYVKSDPVFGEILLFRPDAASERFLPRMSEDLRDPVFVFSNLDDAKRVFGVSGQTVYLTGEAVVAIDNFIIFHLEKEILNSALLKEAYLPGPDLTTDGESAAGDGRGPVPISLLAEIVQIGEDGSLVVKSVYAHLMEESSHGYVVREHLEPGLLFHVRPEFGEVPWIGSKYRIFGMYDKEKQEVVVKEMQHFTPYYEELF